MVLDIELGEGKDPAWLERELRNVPGVLETGLFVGMATRVYTGRTDGTVSVEEHKAGRAVLGRAADSYAKKRSSLATDNYLETDEANRKRAKANPSDEMKKWTPQRDADGDLAMQQNTVSAAAASEPPVAPNSGAAKAPAAAAPALAGRSQSPTHGNSGF